MRRRRGEESQCHFWMMPELVFGEGDMILLLTDLPFETERTGVIDKTEEEEEVGDEVEARRQGGDYCMKRKRGAGWRSYWFQRKWDQ